MTITIPTETTFEDDFKTIDTIPIKVHRSKTSDAEPVDVSNIDNIVVNPTLGTIVNTYDTTAIYKQGIPSVSVDTGATFEFVVNMGYSNTVNARWADEIEIALINDSSGDGFAVKIERDKTDGASNPYTGMNSSPPIEDQRYPLTITVKEVGSSTTSRIGAIPMTVLNSDQTYKLIFTSTRVGVIAESGQEFSFLHNYNVSPTLILDTMQVTLLQNDISNLSTDNTWKGKLKSIAIYPASPESFNPSGLVLASDFRFSRGPITDVGVNLISSPSRTSAGDINHADPIFSSTRGHFQTRYDGTYGTALHAILEGGAGVMLNWAEMADGVLCDSIKSNVVFTTAGTLTDFVGITIGTKLWYQGDFATGADRQALWFLLGKISSSSPAYYRVFYYDGGGQTLHEQVLAGTNTAELEIRLVSQAGGNDEFAFFANGVDLATTSPVQIPHYTFVGGMKQGGTANRHFGFISDETLKRNLDYKITGQLP